MNLLPNLIPAVLKPLSLLVVVLLNAFHPQGTTAALPLSLLLLTGTWLSEASALGGGSWLATGKAMLSASTLPFYLGMLGLTGVVTSQLPPPAGTLPPASSPAFVSKQLTKSGPSGQVGCGSGCGSGASGGCGSGSGGCGSTPGGCGSGCSTHGSSIAVNTASKPAAPVSAGQVFIPANQGSPVAMPPKAAAALRAGTAMPAAPATSAAASPPVRAPVPAGR